MLFINKTNININTRKKKLYQRPGRKYVIRTVKHPLKIHIWGCVSKEGFGNCHIFTKNLNANLLTTIYKKALILSTTRLFKQKTLS